MTTVNGVNFTKTGDPQADLVTYANARGISQAEAKKELEAEFGTPEVKENTSSNNIKTDSTDDEVSLDLASSLLNNDSALRNALLNIIDSNADVSTKLSNFYNIFMQLLSNFCSGSSSSATPTDAVSSSSSSSNSSSVKDTDYTYYSDGGIKTKTIKYEDGGETVENYNSKGELTSKQETKSDGSYTKTTYNGDGSKKQETDYNASTKEKTVSNYNSDGNLSDKKVTQSDGSYQKFTYYSNGNKKQVIDYDASSKETTTTKYSSDGEQTSSETSKASSSSSSSTSSNSSSSSSTSSNTDSYKTARDNWQDKLKTATAYGDKNGIKAAQKAIENLDKARAKGLPPR